LLSHGWKIDPVGTAVSKDPNDKFNTSDMGAVKILTSSIK
jgi:hypothetical protein